ncbi:MAG: tRNA uridine-5-carboxymethylaminomethyl(34) synthesis GTPase MnmE [Hyphomicrobiales bacterium]
MDEESAKHGVTAGGDTIFALSSGQGRAGVAVIRVSGPASGEVLDRMVRSKLRPRRATLRRIMHSESGEVLDHGLVLRLPGPATFTGEDMVEFQVHGGLAVITAILDSIGQVAGTRPAERGEFTRRAFENGRLDLTSVEGVADLTNARTEMQRRQALRQMCGVLGTLYEGWRRQLIAMMAEIEAEIDFPDEGDIPADLSAGIALHAERMSAAIRAHMDDERCGERLRQGLYVVLAGRANVGKSSLLNRLSRRDVAIVTEQAGTTRDVLEVHLDLEGYPLILADTAGLREATRDIVEREGMMRTESCLRKADITMWVTSPDDRTIPENAPHPLVDSSALWVLNKVDLIKDDNFAIAGAPLGAETIGVSALTGEGLDRLTASLTDRAKAFLGKGEDVIMTQSRHRAALRECLNHLDRVRPALALGPEMAAEDLRRAARALGRIVGRVDVDDLLDVIFRDFCVGK